MCYLDRSNLAYAALQLNARLGFSEAVYGTGASLFFAGYVLCQLPSNAVLLRVGPRAWLPSLVLAWGCVACAFAWMKTARQFYGLRVALGVAEAGVFPALWVVMSRFFGERDLGVAYTLASLGTSAAQVVGAPLAAGLLALDGLGGLAGWQLLFLVEGLPTLALAGWLFARLPDSPATAAFLTPDERAFVAAREMRESAAKYGGHGGAGGAAAPSATPGAGLVAVVRDRRVFAVAAVAALENAAKNGLMYWSPLIIAGLVSSGGGGSDVGGGQLGDAEAATTTRPASAASVTGRRLLSGAVAAVGHPPPGANPSIVALLTALPSAAAAAAMWFCASHSKRVGERRAHIALPLAVAALALTGLAMTVESQKMTAFIFLLLAAALWAPSGVLHTLPASFLAGPAAAAGIALINSLANVGGLVGPAALGALRTRTGSHGAGLGALAVVVAAAAVLAWVALPDPPMPGGGGVVKLVASSASASGRAEDEEEAAAAVATGGSAGAVARRRGS